MRKLTGKAAAMTLTAVFLISSLALAGDGGQTTSDVFSDMVVFSGGYMEWFIDAIENDTSALSTPALADLNSDGKMEIVVMSANGSVNVLNHNGGDFWSSPFQLGEMDLLGEAQWSKHGSLVPPASFPSPLVADVVYGEVPELLIAGGDGLYCLGADPQTVLWKYPIPNGSIFNTPTLVDLEGEPDPSNEDMEIVFARDNENQTTELVILNGNGTTVLQQNITLWNRLFDVSASIVAEDLDGAFWDKGIKRVPGDEEDTSMELVVSRYGYYQVYELKDDTLGPRGGYSTSVSLNYGQYFISTPAVANVKMDQGQEIFIGRNWGMADWTDWEGRILQFDRNGDPSASKILGTQNCAVIGSPAIGDLEGTFYDSWTGNDMELVFGSRNGMLYVQKAADLSDKWSFDAGGAILSSPALCDINYDKELEIIVASESGKIFCLDGDPSDGTDEGVLYPGDGPSQDVLWVYDADTTFGISSPVVADIDLDGQLEVVIGTSDGRVLSLCVGGRSIIGQADWPTFHGNNERTGYYYNYPTKWVEFGPELDENERPDPLIKHIQPGSYITFNLSVLLDGEGITEMNREKIRVHINSSTIKPGWDAWLDTPPDRGNDNPDYVRLASQETATVTLWVYAPWVGESREMARIDVDAYLESNPGKVKTVTCIAILDLFNDFELFFLTWVDEDPLSPLFDHKWDTINPGATGLYTISINNKGNLNDSYEITLSEPPREAGWNWYFVETGTLDVSCSLTAQILADRFGGKSGQTFTVFVEGSNITSSNTKIPITLKGYSMNSDRTELRTDELIMITATRNSVSMFIYDKNYESATWTYYIGVNNTGNKDVITVLFSIEGNIMGWDVRFPGEPVPVYKGQTKVIPFRFGIPHGSRFGEGDRILTIIAGIEGDEPDARVNITLKIPKWMGWEAYISSITDPDLYPGGSLNASLGIYSWSNFDEAVHLTRIDTNDSLEVEITDREGNPIDALPLEAFGDEELVVRITAKEDAIAGNHTVTIRLTPNENKIIEVSATVNVMMVGNLSASYLDGSFEKIQTAPIREIQRYTIMVTNNGNGPDNVSLSLGKFFYRDPVVKVSLNVGWHARFVGASLSPDHRVDDIIMENVSQLGSMVLESGKYYKLRPPADDRYMHHAMDIVLGRGDTAFVDVEVWGDSGDGSYIVEDIGIEFMVRSREWAEPFFLSLDIELLYPDLAFDSRGYSLYDELGNPLEKAPPHRELFLIVNVVNIGEIRSDITTMDVFISGELFCVKDLGPLEPWESREVVIPITSGEGNMFVVIHLDPDNSVYEFRDQFLGSSLDNNNRLSLKFEVEEEPKEGSPLPYIAAAIIASIVLLTIILVVLLLIRKRSAHEGPGQSASSLDRKRIGPENGESKLPPHNESVQ